MIMTGREDSEAHKTVTLDAKCKKQSEMLQVVLQKRRWQRTGRVDVAHGVSKLVDGGRWWIRLLRGDPCSCPWLTHRLSLRLDRGPIPLLDEGSRRLFAVVLQMDC